jgi:hypothetical protein
MAERLDPVPVRQAVVDREPLTLTAPWVRWLEELRRQHQQMQAEIVDLQQRVAALEGP